MTRRALFAVSLLGALALGSAAGAQPFCAVNDNFNNCHFFTLQDCQRAARDMLPRGFCQRATPRPRPQTQPQPPQQPSAQPANTGRTAQSPDFVVTRQAVINGRVATGAVTRG